ncbi:MAG: MATE family efflux transporter [Clostridia bacterium]|nr:MATE family efflux transporter [Clostridia bacterium]
MNRIRSLIGNRAFYRTMFAVALPMAVQQGITTFVNLLDNLMVGRLGTLPMSAVTIDNEFVFIFNLIIFGATAGAGIFTAQFHGKRDADGIRHTLRFKLLISAIAAAAFTGVLLLFEEPLIRLFVTDTNTPEEIAETVRLSKDYLVVILFGLLPFALAQSYSSTMRETGNTVPPMVASIIAIVTNLVLNYLLIFGKLGFPEMGIRGAALATVISRFCELLFLVLWTHLHSAKYTYVKGLFRSFRIPKKLMKIILRKGCPLMLNEFFWSLAMVLSAQCYATRGIQVVAAFNISSTIFNLFSVLFMSMGSTISIIVGNQLGAGELDRAQDSARKMTAFTVVMSFLLTGTMVALSGVIPLLYNTEESVREIASLFIRVDGLFMCVYAFTNAAYFTLRSGGKVFVTILFDSVFSWAVFVPVCLCVAYLTDLPIQWMYPVCAATEIGKAVLGAVFLKQKRWVNQLVADESLTALDSSPKSDNQPSSQTKEDNP